MDGKLLWSLYSGILLEESLRECSDDTPLDMTENQNDDNDDGYN